jgi:ABC-type lipoprotein release transport system permease subunit
MMLFLRLAWRNIWRHKRRTIILIVSVTLSLSLMMFYDGFVEGFQNAIYANAIKVLGGNVQVFGPGHKQEVGANPLIALENDVSVADAARSLPEVAAAGRRIVTGGMATNREGAFSVSIIGIEPEAEAPISLMAQNISNGSYLKSDDRDIVFIGKGLADAMSLKVGDAFTMTGEELHNQMRQRTMTVGGIYDLGMAEVEKKTVYISLAEAQDLYGLTNASSEVVIFLHNLGDESKVIRGLQPSIGKNEVETWQTSIPDLETAINRKSSVMSVFGMIILFIAGIGILNLLMMAIYERTREIGVLAALGMKPGQITWLFLLEGAMLGLVGAAVGVVFGIICLVLLQKVGFDYSSFASLTSYTALISGRVYPTLGLDKLADHVVAVVIISLLASYYPAREAARKDPSVALHFV